ncbi:Gustatory receptor-like protein [Leptotrombidium deliense]|uniref:Gustatory receptor-like protein n=1 Tax=Leptotrombidium deliense TaxID=299467 RepID=A0A443SE98_9ACAR|nr:Gustatory receptor-like protein [Leptotrombidium deliense]
MERKKLIMIVVMITSMIFFFVGIAFEASFYFLYPPVKTEGEHSCHWIIISIYLGLLVNATFLMYASMSEFHMTCSFMQICFKRINEKVRKMVCDLSTADIKSVKAVRKCHNNCIQMVNRANDFWKYYLFILYLFFIPMTVFQSYAMFYSDLKLLEIISSLMWLTSNSLVMIVISLNASLIHTLAYKAYNDLYSLTVTKSSEEIAYEVNIFLNRLNYDNVGFTCWNLLTITPNILLTVATAVITYLLAMKK